MMKLEYENKKSEESILNSVSSICVDLSLKSKNHLFLGDNLQVLRHLISLGVKVDLVYIDPPFATKNVFFVEDGRVSTMSSSSNGTIAYKDTLCGSKFIEFLRERLILARELLSDRGSIYLHTDYKVGHYVKVIMDEIFGIDNFRNDITRVKCNPKNFKRSAYGNVKDLILFYSKSKNVIWNEPKTLYTENDIENLFKSIDENGRRYTTTPLHAPGETKNGETAQAFKGVFPPKGRHWRCSLKELEDLDSKGLIKWSKNGVPRKVIYADEKSGKKKQDIWEYKDPQYPKYPTEKNLNLLKDIIRASTNIDSCVLDFFCGSGTTLVAAEELGRRWIGVDSSSAAIKVVREKIGSSAEYDFLNVSGEV